VTGMGPRTRHARALFAGIAPQYGAVAAVWSFGQDPRWRRFMVGRVAPPNAGEVLDVASGTGLVARALLRARPDVRVVALDPSREMLEAARPHPRVARVRGRAEELPFDDAAFDALTFTYLLRYVDDPAATMRELARVLRPGGTIASLEFHVPDAHWARASWRLYTRRVMPAIGAGVSRAWASTGRFLGPSIERHWATYPLAEQVAWWEDAGIDDVRWRTLALGSAIVIWGTRR
jgi:demethylmenaquinone methyltransferase / 2-methoxy-6-polyprenyl-1,4-benzoquinol methylase